MGDEMKAFAMKILLPALVAISMKIAIMNKSKKVTLFHIVTSFVTGIGSAYLFSDLIMETFSDKWVPLAVAIVTISGEKIGYYIIFKLNVEDILSGIVKKYTK